jgi:hypothetical protein
MLELLRAFRRLAGVLDYAHAAWLAPLFLALAGAGFEREWDDSLYLFEKGEADDSFPHIPDPW